jgi:polyribonucleotide nucleotidyltransferase
MKPEAKYFSTTLGGKEVTFETGRIARLAGGSVVLRQGDSMMFAAATMGGVREGTDFFPLTVDYEERMYAGGKIPGSFFRREGRPPPMQPSWLASQTAHSAALPRRHAQRGPGRADVALR